jgi:hypothetical protein
LAFLDKQAEREKIPEEVPLFLKINQTVKRALGKENVCVYLWLCFGFFNPFEHSFEFSNRKAYRKGGSGKASKQLKSAQYQDLNCGTHLEETFSFFLR